MSWRRRHTATYWAQVLLTIAALFRILAGLSNRGSLRAQALCLELVLTPLASYLQLSQAISVLVIFLFDTHLLPLIYTGASLDWRFGRGSTCNKYIQIQGVHQSALVRLSHVGRPYCALNGSGRVCLITGNNSGLSGAVPQTLTLFGGVGFNAWRLRHPSLGECRQGPRHFWKCLARVGYGPEPETNLKRPCAILVRLMGRRTNTVPSNPTSAANWRI